MSKPPVGYCWRLSLNIWHNNIMEQLYSLQSAAKKLDVSVKTIRREMRKKGIPINKVGSRIRISESDLEKLVTDIRLSIPDMK